jgi:hypothetical protein
MKLKFSRQISEESNNFTFHQNPSSVSRVVPYGWTDERTDKIKVILAFRNFANGPKINKKCEKLIYIITTK